MFRSRLHRKDLTNLGTRMFQILYTDFDKFNLTPVNRDKMRNFLDISR